MNHEKYYEELLEALSPLPVINTHAHHHRDEEFRAFSLKKLINESYVAWVNPIPKEVQIPDEQWFEAIRCNNAFYWLQRGIQQIHQTELTLCRENFHSLSQIIEEAHRDITFHLQAMKRIGYKKILLDCYWDTGSDNGYPEIFSPMFRVNMFFYGYSKTARCHNGFNPFERFPMGEPESIDEYCQKVYDILYQAKLKGAVALKSALPYDRGLNLFDCNKAIADKAFLRCLQEQGDSEDIERFQGYLLNRLCEMAVQLDFPFQMHTGLGKMVHSNAIWLQPTIENHPETQFMLLHGSFPWCDDMLGLAHHYRNVHPDLCWMPVLSTSVTRRFLDDLLEVGRSDGICWGCDTWTAEESLGSLLAAQETVAQVLSVKIVAGRIDKDDALRIAQAVFFDNANRLYFKNQLSR